MVAWIRETQTFQVSAPSLKYDGRWYWYYNSGLQAQSGAFIIFRVSNTGLIYYTVLYRSKDSKLPDFSKDIGPGGEVFFDVSYASAGLPVTRFKC